MKLQNKFATYSLIVLSYLATSCTTTEQRTSKNLNTIDSLTQVIDTENAHVKELVATYKMTNELEFTNYYALTQSVKKLKGTTNKIKDASIKTNPHYQRNLMYRFGVFGLLTIYGLGLNRYLRRRKRKNVK